jgi:hypothetical protein
LLTASLLVVALLATDLIAACLLTGGLFTGGLLTAGVLTFHLRRRQARFGSYLGIVPVRNFITPNNNKQEQHNRDHPESGGVSSGSGRDSRRHDLLDRDADFDGRRCLAAVKRTVLVQQQAK